MKPSNLLLIPLSMHGVFSAPVPGKSGAVSLNSSELECPTIFKNFNMPERHSRPSIHERGIGFGIGMGDALKDQSSGGILLYVAAGLMLTVGGSLVLRKLDEVLESCSSPRRSNGYTPIEEGSNDIPLNDMQTTNFDPFPQPNGLPSFPPRAHLTS